jgi:hypothetical protein
LEFLGLADPRTSAVKLDPKVRKSLPLDFVRALPQAGPPEATAVVIVEDLHWIDAASENSSKLSPMPWLVILEHQKYFAVSAARGTGVELWF